MSERVIPLRAATDAEQVGGKAAVLGRLLRARLPVPDGFVVTAKAYDEHLERAFADLPRTATRESRYDAILRTPIAARLQDAVRAAWTVHILAAAAVRSSATVEDSVSASYAGQFHTDLHVTDVDSALASIRRCWASLHSKHALAYSDARRAVATEGRMAVVVQEMVDPAFAGVAFTRDPESGDDDVAFVEWVAGTADKLVSGDALDGRLWLRRDGRVLRIDYLNGTEVPPGAVWRELAHVLQRVITLLGPRQDVEWAWTGQSVLLLQARPDTTAVDPADHEPGPPPWILPGRPIGGWTEWQLKLFEYWDEYNPPVVYPLDFHLYMAAIWQSSLDMLDRGDGVPPIERVVVQYEDVPIAIDPAGRIAGTVPSLPRGNCAPDFEAALDALPGQVRDLEARFRELDRLADQELLDLLESTAACYRDIQTTRLLRGMDRWINGQERAENTLRSILCHLDLDVDSTLEVLQSGVEHETSRMNRAFAALVRDAIQHGKTKEWKEKLDAFVERFGHMESEGILICEEPELIVAQLDRLIEAGVTPSEVGASDRSAELQAQLSRRLRETGKARLFSQQVAALRRYVRLREDSKTLTELPLPLLLRLRRAAGLRLMMRGILKRADDVQLLTLGELRAAFMGRAVDQALLVRRAGLVRWKAKRTSWLPSGFLGQECSPNDPLLTGTAASHGIGEGPARIVRGPREFGSVCKGDVVVAKSTNPVWTQLFHHIAAIVVENGSRLSHAAVVAREVGIPAVVGIPGLLRAVRDGERLRVDGTNGVVRRLDLQDTRHA